MAVYHLERWAVLLSFAAGHFSRVYGGFVGLLAKGKETELTALDLVQKLYVMTVICLFSARCGARATHAYTARKWLSLGDLAE